MTDLLVDVETVTCMTDLLTHFYAVFWQPFWKWQTSWKFLKRRIAPLMVTYHYVKFYVSIITDIIKIWYVGR
jgi:hypothetical protein